MRLGQVYELNTYYAFQGYPDKWHPERIIITCLNTFADANERKYIGVIDYKNKTYVSGMLYEEVCQMYIPTEEQFPLINTDPKIWLINKLPYKIHTDQHGNIFLAPCYLDYFSIFKRWTGGEIGLPQFLIPLSYQYFYLKGSYLKCQTLTNELYYLNITKLEDHYEWKEWASGIQIRSD